MTAWRLFVAAIVPADAAAQVWQGLEGVRARHPDLRWIRPEQMHLTLLFLGPTDASRVPGIGRVVARAAVRHTAAAVVTSDMAGRADGRRGGVSWLSLSGPGVEALSRLSEELDAALPGPRRGRINPPHLTIARRVSEAALADVAPPAVPFTVDRIAVFRSHTGRQGARYEELATSILRIDAGAGHP